VTRLAAIAICTALMPAVAGAQACPLTAADGERLTGSSVSIAWRAEPAAIPIGRHFSLRLLACTPEQRPFAGTLAVDASMPVHRHGMNYRATVRSEGNGRFVVEGLLFHMPGQWRIAIDADTGSGREHLVADVAVE